MNLEEFIQCLEVLFKWSLSITIGLGFSLALLKIIATIFKKQIFAIIELMFSW